MLRYDVIGARIRTFRKKSGYTQEQLAMTISSSTAYVSNIEHGIKKPSQQKLAQIAEAFGVTVDDLISAGDHIMTTEFPANQKT